MIYYIFFYVLFAFSLIEVLQSEHYLTKLTKSIIFYIVLFFLFLFTGLRDEIGIDYFGYKQIYYALRNGNLLFINNVIEPIFSLLFIIIPKFIWCVLIIAVVTIFTKGSVFYNYNYNYCFTALFFYYASEFLFYDMGIMRQGLSIGICLLSIKYLRNKDIRFFVFVLFATMIHTSSILFSIMWLLNNKEYSRKVYYGFSIVSFLIYLFGAKFINFLYPLMEGSNLISGKINKFSTYSEVNISISIIRRLLFLFLFIEMYKKDTVLVINNKRIFKRNSLNNSWLYINMFFLSTILLSFWGTIFSSVAGRMTECFYISYIFIYINIFSDRKKIVENLFLFVLFVILAYMTFYDTIVNHCEQYLPYKNILCNKYYLLS